MQIPKQRHIYRIMVEFPRRTRLRERLLCTTIRVTICATHLFCIQPRERVWVRGCSVWPSYDVITLRAEPFLEKKGLCSQGAFNFPAAENWEEKEALHKSCHFFEVAAAPKFGLVSPDKTGFGSAGIYF